MSRLFLTGKSIVWYCLDGQNDGKNQSKMPVCAHLGQRSKQAVDWFWPLQKLSASIVGGLTNQLVYKINEYRKNMKCYTYVSVGQIKSIAYHPTQEFINLDISRNHQLYRILAGQSSSGKLGGREVCTSKQEAVGSNPARVACEVVFRQSESTEYAVLYTCRCRTN